MGGTADSLGDQPETLAVHGRVTGVHGEDIRVTLGHRDREHAKAYALEQAAKLRQGRDDIGAERLSMSRLVAVYTVHRTPRRATNEQNEDRRRIAMWTQVLGAQKGRIKDHARRWEHFADLRASGELNAQGERVAKPHGAIRWRADEDKMGREWIAPISAKVRLAPWQTSA